MKQIRQNEEKKRGKGTQDVLLAALFSTALCILLLVGATFAWYSASVSTPAQTISAGNINVEFSYFKGTYTETQPDFEDATATGVQIFGTTQFLIPGDAVYTVVRVKNTGDIGIGFDIHPILTGNSTGKDYENNSIDLTSSVGVVLADLGTTTEWTAADNDPKSAHAQLLNHIAVSKLLSCYDSTNYSGDCLSGKAEPNVDEYHYYAIGLYVPEEVNLAYDPSAAENRPSFTLTLRLRASQLIGEGENRNPVAMPWDGVSVKVVEPTTEGEGENETTIYSVGCAEELKYVIDQLTKVPDLSGKYEIRLTADIELNGRPLELKEVSSDVTSVQITGACKIYNLNMKTSDDTITETTPYLFMPDEKITYSETVIFSGTSVTRP